VRLSLLVFSALLMSILRTEHAVAANCPNLNAHPGITTVIVQSDLGAKDQASKAYVASLQEAITKSPSFCQVNDVRAATYAIDVAGVDLDEEHERAALSVALVSEKGSLMSHWVRLSSIENVDKNGQDDLTKVDRAIMRAKRTK
jgi:hypothetical protein